MTGRALNWTDRIKAGENVKAIAESENVSSDFGAVSSMRTSPQGSVKGKSNAVFAPSSETSVL